MNRFIHPQRRTLGLLFIGGLLLTSCEVRPPQDLAPPPPVPTTPEPPALTLYEAALKGDLAILQQYEGMETQWNKRNADGFTALHLAVMADQPEVVAWLLQVGVDVNIADAYGTTALHMAASQNQLAIARLLIQGDADLDAKDGNGISPVQAASFMEYEDMVEFLVGAGARFQRDAYADKPEPAQIIEPPPVETPTVRLEGDFRTWTSASREQMEAEFVEVSMDLVVLRTRDDRLIRVPIQHLRGEDQILARQLAAASLPSRSSPTRPERPDRSPSTALRMGRESGWTVLEGCRLTRSSSNDGDSFYARHEDKEYIFRLYYVDAAETSMDFPQRVEEQAEYFGLTPKDMLKLGEEATRFTHRLLNGKTFTAVTRWEDARGRSRLPRHFAFIVTEEGDLDELLTAEGLVRIYGMPVPGSLGRTKRSDLERLEESARRQRLGAWGMGRK